MLLDQRSTASTQSSSPALKLHPTVDKVETTTSEQTVTTCDSGRDKQGQKWHHQNEHNDSLMKAKNERQAEDDESQNNKVREKQIYCALVL